MPLSFKTASIDPRIKRAEDNKSEIASFSGDIFVMPKEFYIPPKSQGGKSGIKWLILLVVLILLAFGAAAFYVLVIQKKSTETSELTPTSQDMKSQEQAVSETASPQSTTTEEIAEPIATSTEPVVSEGKWSVLALLPASVDIDEDGLTDIEELFFGTDGRESDSDGDSFTDGSEVLSGYDPAKKGAPLRESALFTRIVVAESRLSLEAPQSWQKTEDKKEARTIFTAVNGDSIIIEVVKKETEGTLSAWIEKNVSGLNSTNLNERVFDGVTGVAEPGGRRVFILIGNSIVIVSYDVGKKLEVAYPTLWEHLLSSITIL